MQKEDKHLLGVTPELLTYFHSFSSPKETLLYLLSTSPQSGSLLFIASSCLPSAGHVCPEFVLPSPHQTQNRPEISCNLFCFNCNLSHASNEENRLPLSRSKTATAAMGCQLSLTLSLSRLPPLSRLLQRGRGVFILLQPSLSSGTSPVIWRCPG